MPERISATHKPLSTSWGCSDLCVFATTYSMFLMSGLSSFSTACSEAMENLASGFLCSYWSSTRQQSSLRISPSANPPMGVVSIPSSSLHPEGSSAQPCNSAFPGCGVTHWSCNHLRLNEKGQGYVRFLPTSVSPQPALLQALRQVCFVFPVLAALVQPSPSYPSRRR